MGEQWVAGDLKHRCLVLCVADVMMINCVMAAETHLVALTKTKSVVSVQINDESKPKAGR